MLHLDGVQEPLVRGPKLRSLVDIAVIARKMAEVDAVELCSHLCPGVGPFGCSLGSDLGDSNQQQGQPAHQNVSLDSPREAVMGRAQLQGLLEGAEGVLDL